MSTQRLSVIVSGAVALSLLTLPALAHHGWSGNTEALMLSGSVVTPVSLAGPHATMQIRDEDGQVWDITLAPPPRTSRAGLTEDVLPVGAEVTVEGMRNASPSRYEIKTRKVSWNGDDFDVYPQ